MQNTGIGQKCHVQQLLLRMPQCNHVAMRNRYFSTKKISPASGGLTPDPILPATFNFLAPPASAPRPTHGLGFNCLKFLQRGLGRSKTGLVQFAFKGTHAVIKNYYFYFFSTLSLWITVQNFKDTIHYLLLQKMSWMIIHAKIAYGGSSFHFLRAFFCLLIGYFSVYH